MFSINVCIFYETQFFFSACLLGHNVLTSSKPTWGHYGPQSHIASDGHNPDIDVKQGKKKSQAMNTILCHKNISLFLHAHTTMDPHPVVSVAHVSVNGDHHVLLLCCAHCPNRDHTIRSTGGVI